MQKIQQLNIKKSPPHRVLGNMLGNMASFRKTVTKLRNAEIKKVRFRSFMAMHEVKFFQF